MNIWFLWKKNHSTFDTLYRERGSNSTTSWVYCDHRAYSLINTTNTEFSQFISAEIMCGHQHYPFIHCIFDIWKKIRFERICENSKRFVPFLCALWTKLCNDTEFFGKKSEFSVHSNVSTIKGAQKVFAIHRIAQWTNRAPRNIPEITRNVVLKYFICILVSHCG